MLLIPALLLPVTIALIALSKYGVLSQKVNNRQGNILDNSKDQDITRELHKRPFKRDNCWWPFRIVINRGQFAFLRFYRRHIKQQL